MSNRPSSFMPFYVGDYLRDTLSLTRSEHGGYLLLLMAYWAQGGSLADDDRHLAAITRSSAAAWRTLRPVLEPFFQLREGKWHHKRIDHELKKATDAYERRKEAGVRGNKSERRRNAAAMRPQPEPQPQDLSPQGSSRRGSRARERAAAPALPAPPATSDWSESASEAWRAFKTQLSANDWRAWFAPCRLEGEATLIAPTRFSADMIAEKFGEALALHVGPVTITSEDRKAAA